MRIIFLLLSCFFLAVTLMANNIQVANISLTGQNTTDQTTDVQFDLNWENSWRISVGPANWDAAWVFVKYRVNGATWRHATLSQTGNTATGGSAIDVSPDGKGAFIYRAADGSGDVNFADLKLRWNYGDDNVDDNALVDVQVFAVEMVYVPEGAYQLGTGRPPFNPGEQEAGEFYTRSQVSGFIFQNPYNVTSEAAITVANTLGNLFYSTEVAGSNPGDQLGPIPASFPKGFGAFYSMKYEVTQDQWIGFFNSLTQTQKEALDITGTDGKNTDVVQSRNGIAWPDAGNATTTLPNVAVNFTRPTFLAAYLDWSALRPLTELEYEKSGRGTRTAVDGEFAWGTANIHAQDYEYLNEDTPSSLITNPGEGVGNVIYDATTSGGPRRVGVLAASATNSNREETGGSYYGIMELSGNLYERVISVGNPAGRSFTGTHGDGTITSAGRHNVAGWPGNDAIGWSYRGGSYFNGANFIRLSDRFDGASVIASGNNRLGFRGGRTAE